MFRIMSIATLVLIALCFFIGAGFAFADERKVDISTGAVEEQINDASRPVEDLYEPNLADRDRYDFTDYLNGPTTGPVIDSESIEEPEVKRTKRVEA